MSAIPRNFGVGGRGVLTGAFSPPGIRAILIDVATDLAALQAETGAGAMTLTAAVIPQILGSAGARCFDLLPGGLRDLLRKVATDIAANRTASGFTSASVLSTGGGGPYSLANSDTLRVSVDGVAALVATISAAAAARESAAGPFDLEPGDFLRVAINGGADQDFTFLATAGSRVSGAETFVMTGGGTLTLKVDGGLGQTFTFVDGDFAVPGAATAAEVEAVISATITGATASPAGGVVTITSSTRGTGSSIEITGGSLRAALGFTLSTGTGTGNVVNIDAVTVTEVMDLINATITDAAATLTSGSTKVTITTTRKGTGAIINVKTSTANTGANHLQYTTGALAGTGNVAILSAVTRAEIAAILTAALGAAATAVVEGSEIRITSAAVGGEQTPTIEVETASTADDELGFDNLIHGDTLLYDLLTELDSAWGDGGAGIAAIPGGRKGILEVLDQISDDMGDINSAGGYGLTLLTSKAA